MQHLRSVAMRPGPAPRSPQRFDAICATLDAPWQPNGEELAALANAPDAPSLATGLRQLRQRAFLTTLLRDLTGRADLAEVCRATTRLAEISIQAAVSAHSRWLSAAHGEPIGAESGKAQQLLVIAMGKLGGSELNVSSDVDLVFAYPEDGATNGRKPLANQDYFDRLGRALIAALDEITADGFVFRVDMRLRPYGDSGRTFLLVRDARAVSDHAGPDVGALRVAEGPTVDRRPGRRS